MAALAQYHNTKGLCRGEKSISLYKHGKAKKPVTFAATKLVTGNPSLSAQQDCHAINISEPKHHPPRSSPKYVVKSKLAVTWLDQNM